MGTTQRFPQTSKPSLFLLYVFLQSKFLRATLTISNRYCLLRCRPSNMEIVANMIWWSRYSTNQKHFQKEGLLCKSIPDCHMYVQMSTIGYARLAMGTPQDLALLQETANFVATKARDHDIMLFFTGLVGNFQARRFATKYFFDNYDAVSEFMVVSSRDSNNRFNLQVIQSAER